jgi:hypothetical protein
MCNPAYDPPNDTMSPGWPDDDIFPKPVDSWRRSFGSWHLLAAIFPFSLTFHLLHTSEQSSNDWTIAMIYIQNINNT